MKGKDKKSKKIVEEEKKDEEVCDVCKLKIIKGDYFEAIQCSQC